MKTENKYLDYKVCLDKTVYRSVLSQAISNISIEYPAFKMLTDYPLLNKLFCKKGSAIVIDCKGRYIIFRVIDNLNYRWQAVDFLESLAVEYGRLTVG